jgi:hypothetical protein
MKLSTTKHDVVEARNSKFELKEKISHEYATNSKELTFELTQQGAKHGKVFLLYLALVGI